MLPVYLLSPVEIQVLVFASMCINLPDFDLHHEVMEGFDWSLLAIKTGKPTRSGSLYNLTVRFILQRQLIMIVELDKVEAKVRKLARNH